MCAIEFGRVASTKHKEVAKVFEDTGYEVIDASSTGEGPSEFASEIRLKYNKSLED